MRLRRHASRVVLWGGRPGLDRQLGSACDHRLADLARPAGPPPLIVIDQRRRRPAAPPLGHRGTA